MATKKQSTATKAVEVGAGLAALAAAASAGYYFYASDNAKKHRASASKWATGMKKDVLKEAKKLKKIDQKQMAAIVDKAVATYSSVRTVNQHQLKAAATELKKNWKLVSGEVSGQVKKAVKTAKKAAKKRPAAKKAAKRTMKKMVKKAAKKAVKTVKKATKKATKKRSR